jgi:hypothetical protein
MPDTYLRASTVPAPAPPFLDFERRSASGGFHFVTLVSGCNAQTPAMPREDRLSLPQTPANGPSASDRSLPYPGHACHRRNPAFARRVHRVAWAPADDSAGQAALQCRRVNIRVGTGRAGKRGVPQTDAGRKLCANRSHNERPERSTGWKAGPDHALSVAADSVSYRPGQRKR